MTDVFVVYHDFGGYDGKGPPIGAFSSEEKAYEFIGRRNSDFHYGTPTVVQMTVDAELLPPPPAPSA